MKRTWKKASHGTRNPNPFHCDAEPAMQRALILVSLWLLSPMIHAAGEAKLLYGVFDPQREAHEIDLQGSHGKPLHLSAYRGKVVVLGFGFTSCHDVCPTTLAVLAQALKKVGPL